VNTHIYEYVWLCLLYFIFNDPAYILTRTDISFPSIAKVKIYFCYQNCSCSHKAWQLWIIGSIVNFFYANLECQWSTVLKHDGGHQISFSFYWRFAHCRWLFCWSIVKNSYGAPEKGHNVGSKQP
jgi:hypothetical protein